MTETDELSPELLLYAYSQGVFPMAVEEAKILWFDPDPRAVLPLESFHVPRSLQRLIRQEKFEIRIDSSFLEVICQCAASVAGREETWISPAIVAAYVELHRMGFAHSVECWRKGRLVGGLYGIALRGLFAGESMFSKERDSSKVAFEHLVRRLRAGNFSLLDVQFQTPHLARFGAIEISREAYKQRLANALNQTATFFPELR